MENQFKDCNHFIVFYSTKKGYIELLHTMAYIEEPSLEAVNAIITEITQNPEYETTYGLRYKEDFSVLDLELENHNIDNADELTLAVIDKMIDNAEMLGVDLDFDLLG